MDLNVIRCDKLLKNKHCLDWHVIPKRAAVHLNVPRMKSWLMCIAVTVVIQVNAQYNTAIGLRGGETSGLTIKGFVSDDAALEGIIGVWSHGFTGTLLYEIHAPAFNANGLNWYFGAGGHLAFYSGYHDWYRYGQRRYHYYDDGLGIGIDGVLGLEYKIPRAPIAFSLDLKPFIEFNTYGGSWVSLDPGVGIKVAF
jgi:hypothetical protein